MTEYIVGKEYKLGDKVVRVLAIDRPINNINNMWGPIVAMGVEAGGLFSLAKNGSYGNEQLTEIQPWDTLKPGDLCVINDAWLRVFAGTVDGRPAYWDYVRGNNPAMANTCRLLTEEELAKVKKGI